MYMDIRIKQDLPIRLSETEPEPEPEPEANHEKPKQNNSEWKFTHKTPHPKNGLFNVERGESLEKEEKEEEEEKEDKPVAPVRHSQKSLDYDSILTRIVDLEESGKELQVMYAIIHHRLPLRVGLEDMDYMVVWTPKPGTPTQSTIYSIPQIIDKQDGQQEFDNFVIQNFVENIGKLPDQPSEFSQWWNKRGFRGYYIHDNDNSIIAVLEFDQNDVIPPGIIADWIPRLPQQQQQQQDEDEDKNHSATMFKLYNTLGCINRQGLRILRAHRFDSSDNSSSDRLPLSVHPRMGPGFYFCGLDGGQETSSPSYVVALNDIETSLFFVKEWNTISEEVWENKYREQIESCSMVYFVQEQQEFFSVRSPLQFDLLLTTANVV